MRTTLRRVEFVTWPLIVVASSVAAIVLTRAYDWNYQEGGADHPLYFPLTAAIIVIVAVAGWRVPRLWWVFGFLAWIPQLAVALGIGANLTAEQRPYVLISVVGSLLELLTFVVGAFVGSRIRLGTFVRLR